MSKPDEVFICIKNAIHTRSHETLIFHNIDPRDHAQIKEGLRHRTNYLEKYSFRIHWFAHEKLLKVIVPSKLHESGAKWMYEMISKGLVNGTIPEAWIETMGISPSPEYDNFIGLYEGSTKEGDLTFVPRVGPDWILDAKYPSVVLETGWAESAEQLNRDATLWQRGSDGHVRVVIQLKYFDRHHNRIGARLSIHRGGTSAVEHFGILPADQKEDPLISFDEFYSGACPPGINPQGCVSFNIDRLRVIARVEIRARGNIPDEQNQAVLLAH